MYWLNKFIGSIPTAMEYCSTHHSNGMYNYLNTILIIIYYKCIKLYVLLN